VPSSGAAWAFYHLPENSDTTAFSDSGASKFRPPIGTPPIVSANES